LFRLQQILDDAPKCSEDHSEKRILDLLDIMELFQTKYLHAVIDDLHRLGTLFLKSQGRLSNKDFDEVNDLVNNMDSLLCGYLVLPQTKGKIDYSRFFFKDRKSPLLSYETAQNEIRNILEALERDLIPHLFAVIPENRLDYATKKKLLFSDKVLTAFPDAKKDIEDATDCIIMDFSTATVFHLMRVVECGLRALCDDLGFEEVKTHRKSGQPRYIPIEYAQWEPILNGLPEKIEDRLKSMGGPSQAKQEAQEFYNSSWQEIDALRGAWRNHVMHARTDYGPKDVDQVLDHVQRLMSKLATRLTQV